MWKELRSHLCSHERENAGTAWKSTTSEIPSETLASPADSETHSWLGAEAGWWSWCSGDLKHGWGIILCGLAWKLEMPSLSPLIASVSLNTRSPTHFSGGSLQENSFGLVFAAGKGKPDTLKCALSTLFSQTKASKGTISPEPDWPGRRKIPKPNPPPHSGPCGRKIHTHTHTYAPSHLRQEGGANTEKHL